MKRLFNKKVGLIIGLLFVLTACTNVIDPDTKRVYLDKIIYLDTSFSAILDSDSWFTALLIYPLAQAFSYNLHVRATNRNLAGAHPERFKISCRGKSVIKVNTTTNP